MHTLKNYITLIGKIGTEAQYTKFENGKSVARFKLSTQKTARNNDGNYREITQWHNVFAWGNLAEFIEHYAQKGKNVAIHGRIVNRTYLNPSGLKRNTTEIEIRNIIGLN
jgi:single-strand DNA-binding protein